MDIEIIIETPEGVELGRYNTVEFDSLKQAADKMRVKIDAGYSDFVFSDKKVTLIPNILLRHSIVKLRDASEDKDVPF